MLQPRHQVIFEAHLAWFLGTGGRSFTQFSRWAPVRMPAGTLDVYLDCAKGLKDTEIIGKADPYVVLKAGKATGKTKTCKDQGGSPVWGEKIRLHIAPGCKQLVLTIFNANTFYKDDIMGTATITLSEVFDADNKFPDGTFLSPSADYPVTRVDGKSQGKITLTLVFEEEGNNLNLGE
uniref:C2 domain-containing protein n=2 Tax=Physcomitrium patens TaxID=3218 RepID=A0A7I4DIT9_PHYPA